MIVTGHSVIVQTLDCPDLVSLFGRIEPYVGEDGIRPLPPPESRSSLAADVVGLGGKWLVTPINKSFISGVEQVLTFAFNL